LPHPASPWTESAIPGWVTAVPSASRPGLVEGFARALAGRLDLPFVATLSVVDGAAPQASMANSAQQLANADARLVVDGAAVLAGPVLLVDDLVDSGWTLTVAGWRLRSGGSGEVHPFALAVSSARDG
ncbi:MAG: ATP-dependent DNA helicase RecG, partial [Candidatus Limnocylindrales bacterium]